ncbi:DsrE family protein [Aquibacillus salsiterrae]|uniref:DsrE family protein n=1 Tax=Aquibacillus salsiterrae TaxID=2950439 RepID=A0A9X4AF62_9BACI|nr:DsrE family protein [Aquibacillus salsiterrae]MDC3417536.1 DsrE family protein [Aquibacillus salsiterrae]
MTKVVIQVNQDGVDYFKRVTNNIINLKKNLGVKLIECEIVVFGAGLGLLQSEDDTIRKRIKEILAFDMRFVVCNNTLTNKNVDVNNLQCSVNQAGSGVAHLVTRQEEGWAYLAL